MFPLALHGVPASRSDTAQDWRSAVLALLLLTAWTLFLYRDTGVAMLTIWARSDTFAHCFLVLPIVLWLIWRQRELISVHTPQPALGGLVVIACASFVWLLGQLAAVNAVTQLALVAVIVLMVPAVLGRQVARLIIFPLGFLFFMAPIGEFLMPQLMEWTANFTVFALRLSGIPVYREGLQFIIPSGHWSVVEACSGVRYLIASLTVGVLFAYLNYQSNKRRLLFAIVSILVPVVANWLRAYLIVMLGHLSGNKLAAGVDHLIYGWLFFGFVIMLMFIIGARWAESDEVSRANRREIVRQAPALSLSRLWITTACFATLVALPHIALWGIDRADDADSVVLTSPLVLASTWQVVPLNLFGFKPSFQNPFAEINNSYTSENRTVGLYLGYYRHQNYSHKLVSSDNVLVTSHNPHWAQAASGTHAFSWVDKVLAFRTAELREAAPAKNGNESRLVVWNIYWINGTLTSSDYLAKAYGAFYRLLGRGDKSAVIVVYTLKDEVVSAESVLASFLATNLKPINELLLKTN